MEPVVAACKIETFTTSDGYRCHYRHYPARGPARGRVVAIHGIQSHGGWYSGSCQHLAAAGWEVLFLDRRGSGLNETARGDAPGYRRLVDDLAEFLRATGDTPPFLMAISWGGKLALALEQTYPGSTAGLILVAPGMCPRVRPPLRQRLAIALGRLVSPGRSFPIPLDDPALFTATPHWQEYIRTDPLALRRASARLLVASVFLDRALRRRDRHVRVPLLVLLAGQDRIIDNLRTRNVVASLGSPDCEVIEYADAHHTLEFEPDPSAVFHTVERWLQARQQ